MKIKQYVAVHIWGCEDTTTTLTVNLSRNNIDDKSDMIDIYYGGFESCHDSSSGSSTFIIDNVNTNGYSINISENVIVFVIECILVRS